MHFALLSWILIKNRIALFHTSNSALQLKKLAKILNKIKNGNTISIRNDKG